MIVPVHADGKSGERESKCIVLAMQDGCLCMPHRGRSTFFAQPGAQEEAMMAHRGIRVRQRISGFEGERAFQKRQCLGHLRRHPGIDVGLSLQDEIIGVEAIRPLAFDALDFGPTQAWLNGPDHF